MSKIVRKPPEWPAYKSARELPHGFSRTVQEIVDEWLMSPRYMRLSNGTKRSYSSHLSTWSTFKLPDSKSIFQLRVCEIDYRLVDYFISVMQYRGLAPASVSVKCTVMGIVWKIALRRGLAAYNPWADLRIECDNARDITWSPDEIERALEKCNQLGFNTLALFILFMYETGQRPWVDLRNLTWENIHDDADGIRWLDYVSSKTGVHIRMPISDRLRCCLENRPKTTSFIFSEESGERRTQQALFKQFNRIKREASLTYSLQLRDIRRTVVVELIEAGATRDEVRSVGGWKNDSSIHRYARIRGKTAQNALGKREQHKRLRESSSLLYIPAPQKECSEAH